MQTKWARFTSTKSSVMPVTLIKSSNLLNKHVGLHQTHQSFTRRRCFITVEIFPILVHELPHLPSKWLPSWVFSSFDDRVRVPPAYSGQRSQFFRQSRVYIHQNSPTAGIPQSKTRSGAASLSRTRVVRSRNEFTATTATSRPSMLILKREMYSLYYFRS